MYAYLLKSRFCDVLGSATTGSYQGDEYYVVRQFIGGWSREPQYRYGYGTTGYGSCSFCDTLEAIDGNDEQINENDEQINELADKLYKELRWFSTKELLRDFLLNVDPATAWYANDSEWTHGARGVLLEALELEVLKY